ncbi:hypothetical protein POM88_009452 [Heracleum sosnowskyi]|uniref:Uncharacterized protein n=1 Tax=Heracleum sosnowskyi TaxID=360622 RepID=A0AAD8N7I6_9APIA|nr:hypothetical protein POM88_009452 [Heracleum sosnowskyi]
MMGRALNEVTNMVQAMNGIEEVPRSRLDEELRKMADVAYQNKDDPGQRVLWDQYVKIASSLSASLFERFKMVIVEDNQANDQNEYQTNDGGNRNDYQANDGGNTNGNNCANNEGNMNGRNGDEEGNFNNVPLSL